MPGGHFGPYGGRYVPEVLMAPIEELETAYLEAREDPAFQAELADLLHNYAGRPTPLYFAKRPQRDAGRRAHLAQARRPAAHRRAQDQQLPGAGAAGAAHGQAPHHRRDRRGPARRGHRHGLRAARLRVRGLHGRGGHAPAAPQRLPHAPAGRESGRRDDRQPHPEGRHQRSHARLGDQRRRHLLPAGLGAGLASLPHDGARFSQGDRRGSAPPDSGSRRPPARRDLRLRGRRQQRHRHLPRLPAGRRAWSWSASKPAAAATRIGEHAARFRGGAPGVLQGAYSYRAAGRRRPDRAHAFRFRRAGLRHDRPRARLAARPRAAPSTSPPPTPKRWTPRACSRASKASFRRSNRRTPWPKPSSARPPPRARSSW